MRQAFRPGSSQGTFVAITEEVKKLHFSGNSSIHEAKRILNQNPVCIADSICSNHIARSQPGNKPKGNWRS